LIGRCVALLDSSWDRHQSRSSCLARLTILHRHTTHNKCYSSFKDFSIAMLRFLRDDVPRNWRTHCDEVTDNFRVIDPKRFRIIV
jgi:hypothetical protein